MANEPTPLDAMHPTKNSGSQEMDGDYGGNNNRQGQLKNDIDILEFTM